MGFASKSTNVIAAVSVLAVSFVLYSINVSFVFQSYYQCAQYQFTGEFDIKICNNSIMSEGEKQYNFTPIRRINMSDGFKFTEEWHRNLKDPVVIVLPPGKNQEVLDFYQGQFGDREIEVMDWSKYQPDHRSVFAAREPRVAGTPHVPSSMNDILGDVKKAVVGNFLSYAGDYSKFWETVPYFSRADLFIGNFPYTMNSALLHANNMEMSVAWQLVGKKSWLFIDWEEVHEHWNTFALHSYIGTSLICDDFLQRVKKLYVHVQQPGELIVFPKKMFHQVHTFKGPNAMINLRKDEPNSELLSIVPVFMANNWKVISKVLWGKMRGLDRDYKWNRTHVHDMIPTSNAFYSQKRSKLMDSMSFDDYNIEPLLQKLREYTGEDSIRTIFTEDWEAAHAQNSA